MLTYCLKRKKGIENVDSKMLKTKNVDQCHHQNVLHVVMKNQDL